MSRHLVVVGVGLGGLGIEIVERSEEGESLVVGLPGARVDVRHQRRSQHKELPHNLIVHLHIHTHACLRGRILWLLRQAHSPRGTPRCVCQRQGS